MVGVSPIAEWSRAMAPPPAITVSQWADRERMRPETSAARGGRWRTSTAPYLAGIMDSVHEAGVKKGAWRDEHGTMKLPGKEYKAPGVSYADMTKDQKGVVEKVMKELVSPYRKEDGDEVMEIIKANGGLEKMCFAFYQDNSQKNDEKWAYWRLEGPGFVWSFRSLPHIHTFVYIGAKMA